MLWVDDNFVTQEDLSSIDSEVDEILDISGISADNVIQRAKDNCRNYLSRFMSFSNLAPTDLAVRDVNLPITVSSLRYNYAGFAQLIVSGPTEQAWSALKEWTVNKTLLLLYKSATNKSKDRYSDRYDGQLEDVVHTYWPNLKRRGLPIVFNPLPAPGAIEENNGTFNTDNLSLVAGSGTLNDDIEVAITWVGSNYQSPTDKRNSESYRSKRIPYTLVGNNVLHISKAGLIAPNGGQPLNTMASCRYNTAVAVGWNVWIGNPGGLMYRQNQAVIDINTNTFTLPDNPVLSGETLDLGQVEEVVLEVSTEMIRGD